MNKTVLNQLKKIIIAVVIFLVVITALFVLTSCKSVSGESSIGGNDTVVSTSATETTVAVGTSTTSDSETTTKTTGSSTETTAPAETTSQTTKPQTQQTVEVTAKTGGYYPGKIEAKAGVPTILIMKSEGAYGCERAFNIFDPNTKKVLQSEILPENGQTKFDLGTQAKGTKLFGVCSMGMYYFQMSFS
ncbi:MAG TPA: cupredoxin domain-containing protein [Candidatus Humimicrobiaceae bacterium]